MRKTCFFVVCALSFILPFSARAAMLFTEVMYDPDGSDADREWVELQNTGDTSVDISGWKFGDADSPNHTIYPASDATNPGQGSSTIAPGAFFILASNAQKFLAMYPGFSGTVFDTVMSLRNTGGTLTLRKESDGNALSAVTYDPDIGGKNDGTSLQRTSDGSWTPTTPTPGAVYGGTIPTASSSQTTTPPITETQTTIGGPPAGSTAEEKTADKKVTTLPKVMHAEIRTLDSDVVSGIPARFTMVVFSSSGERLPKGVFRVAFGDGSLYEATSDVPFTHTYRFDGRYVATVSYRSHPYVEHSEVTGQVIIDVMRPAISIRAYGLDGSLELQNLTEKSVDISGWRIFNIDSSSEGEAFIFPEGTILLESRNTTIDVSGTMLVHKRPVALAIPSGKVVALYGVQQAIANEQPEMLQSPSVAVIANTTKSQVQTSAATILPATAYAATAKTQENMPIQESPASRVQGTPLWVFLLGLGGVIGGSIIALRMISERQAFKKHSEENVVNESLERKVAAIRIIEDDEA